MIDSEKDWNIVKNIIYTYIIQSPVNRTLVLPVLITMAIAKYLEVLGASQTKEISRMIKNGQNDFSTIFIYSLVGIAAIVLVEMQSFLICKAGQSGYRKSNLNTYRYFLDLRPEEFGTVGKGEITSTIARKSQAVQDMIDVLTLNFFPTLLTLFFVSLEVFNGLGIDSAIIINICVILYAVVTVRITTWRNSMRKSLIHAQNKASNLLIDGLYNYETIFTYNSEDTELEKYNLSLKNVERHSTDVSRSLYILNLAQRSIWWLMSIVLILISIYRADQKATTEQFVFLVYIIGVVVKSLDNFGFMYGKLQAAIINAKLTNLTSRSSANDGYRTAYSFDRVLEVKDLNLEVGNKMILNNASFTINYGDKVAIIGKNGSGKTTMLKSLVKLANSKGLIEIDGISVRDITDVSFKQLISYIPQNVVLFDDTVMQNIKYGNSKIYDEEIFRISQELGIHESIIKLEQGYSTRVGEQGKSLSGGERQKVAILRARARNSQILIMDESTSNLDKQSESKIMKSILQDQNTTVLSIIHNMEFLNLFNKILWINEGTITEVQNVDEIDFESWYTNKSMKEVTA